MRALIDADLLVYECAFGAEDRETGFVSPFSQVADRLDKRIMDIVDAVGADTYTLFLTGKGNFRDEVAKTRPYKDKRPKKPYHYKNIRAYIESLGAEVVDGMEADDALAIWQAKNDIGGFCSDATVICSRDKDLRQVSGWHYGWEAHNQPEQAKYLVTEFGGLFRNDKGKVVGDGLMWFYCQLMMGDPTDTIEGIKGCGQVKAYNTLKDCKSEKCLYRAVLSAYEEEGGGRKKMLEMGQLLWMIREVNEDGTPVMWELYDER